MSQKKSKQIIDCTYPIHEGMLTFGAPWHPQVSIKQMGRHGVEGRETREITFGTHTGTQVDAPLHFIPGGNGIHDVSLSKLVGPVTILDFSHLGPHGAVSAAMLRRKKFGSRVIMKFGWGRYWNTKDFYTDWPYIQRDAAEYLLSKKIQLLGLDTPSPDDSRIVLKGSLLGSEDDSPIHKLLLGSGVALVEYIANLDHVRPLTGWKIAALPLPILGADGSPARVILFS